MTNKYGAQVVIDGMNMFDIITIISKKNKRYIANALDEMEEVLGSDTEAFIKVRKIFLDTQNDYTRSIFVTLFGDIEGIF
ncbi:hypothetical protein LCGC14_0748110 [marine sediment metagenome]|uniref:Uncharacterized protein n=1 Tax=marine sediment metagenome TaxID=412755 RepID=A0A0F9QPN3_9ZZZZ